MSEQYSSDEDACICNGEVGSRSSHKRKEVHNEVERRRKDKINIGILRLGELLPDKDPRKQSKNGILERASEYITYLKDLNEKLVMDKVTNLEATVFAGLRKQIRDLEELNANYARLLTTAGIPLTSGPEEIWDHKPKKYSLKHLPDKQRALLACTEVKTVLQQQQPCQHHGTTVMSSRPAAEPLAPKAPQAAVAPAVPPAPPPASCAREAMPGCTLVTQALPSAPVMSTAQPSAVTVFQQQHPLTAAATGVATGTAGGVVSQPILMINDQGVPVLQNVVTFQNTSIILNPQGHAMGARTPGSVVSFTGPDMLPQVHLATGQSTDDFAHSAAALGGLMQCDPKLKEAAKLCGVQQNAATFLSSAGMMMNQPLLSLGTGTTMIAGQTAPAPQVPSAFLLPSGQIIPVVSQPQVVSAPMQSAHPLGSQVAANVAAAVSSCSTSLGKVVQCDGAQSYMCREHASSVQHKTLASTPSSGGTAVGNATAQPGGNCRKQHHTCPQHSSPSSSKCIAVPDSSRTKPVCSHAASKQPLCSIRPKPTPQTPDSSQAKPSCTRKSGGGKKVSASKPSSEIPAKRARADAPRSDEETASHASTCSSTTATTSAQSTEGVSSTSNKEISPLAADILAQATESIFSCGGNVEAAVNQAAQSKNKSPVSASSSDQSTVPPAVSIAATVETNTGARASTTITASSPPSTSVTLTQSHCSRAPVLAEAVCSSDAVPANSTVEEASKIKDIFENGRPTEIDAETTSTTSQVSAENGAQSALAKDGQDDIQASDNDRNELPSLSLHSIVMEENIDISPSVSSTTFTESYVSVSASSNGHSTPQGSSKIPDCAASILCQLTPPSSKGSEDNSKAFVSSTDSLASDQELPLILSIPEDDGHGSLNSNSNPGLSFPSLSPGDQLEHELGNGNAKTAESTSSLSQFVLTPPTPHLPASTAQVSVTSSTNKKKESSESSTYTYVASESFPTPPSHSEELHTIGNTSSSSSKQDCHHASRSPQLHSAPPAKLHMEASCHSFVSNAPRTLPMHSRGLQFSTASAASTPAQVHHISLPGFSTAQGFAAPKEPESLPLLDNSSKPPPSPCRMIRDSGRCSTPSKSPSAQFPMSINPYMTTPSFPFPRPDQYTPCTRTLTPQSNTPNSSNTALSCYSAEALIGTQNFLPSSYRLTPPSCAQVPTTQRSSCQQSSRPQISYSAESLIQSQASNPKKDLQATAKEPSFSNHPGFVNRLPSYQPQTSTHTTAHSHQRQLPASTSQQMHLPSTTMSGAPDNRSQALPVSTTVPPQPTTVHSSYTVQLSTNTQRSLATTPSRYPIHTYHTAKDDFPMLPSAPLHTPPLHTMAPHMSQSPSSRGHHVQPDTSSNQNMFQHQNYPYPNFSLGHRSPSFGTCTASRPEVPATSRAPASCLQATSPRQSHFGMQVPTSQQQGCLFPSASSASLLPLTSEFGPQCSGPLAPPPPPVFGNLSQHCAQAPHLVNNLIPGPFATSGNTICGTSLPQPGAESEKQGGRRDKQGMHLMSETGCPDPEKQQSKSKSKKNKPSNTSSHTAVNSIPYFPDFRNESHNHALITLPPPPAPSQKLPHTPSLPSMSTSTSSALPWPHHQQQHHHQLQQTLQPPHTKPSHTSTDVERSANISSATYNPLFRPQSQQNSINLNLNGSCVPTPHSSSAASFSHHHSPLQRNAQHSSASTSSVASVVSMTSSSISTATQVAPYSNCAVAPSQHVPNFNLSNIFPDIGSGEQGRASAAPPPPPPSTHFYPSSRVLHNSFNHILPPPPPPAPPHNNFVHSGHHAPSFSNVIPPLTFPMHEH
ncbi:uncharacterized protein LOC142582650 [Dermacentor variabilis]|uniref:uncharacterized protein LOC142582650 n=1 Tax=Dermacentor variabilis TaxID=34621 RepID=UPI003F5BFF58